MVARPEAINEMKRIIALFGRSLLANGRQLILNTNSPSLADIEVS